MREQSTPTLQEARFREFVAEGWLGVFAPPATPRPVVLRLNQAILKVLAQPETALKFSERDITLSPSTPEAFKQKVAQEVE